MKQTFEQKIKGMPAKEIIIAMVDALRRPPIVNINMGTFGGYKEKEVKFLGIRLYRKVKCFGCAATNTICKIANIKPYTLLKEPVGKSNRLTRAENLKTGYDFLESFEIAIDRLRKGNIDVYNFYALQAGFATIYKPISPNMNLPYLDNDYTNKDLEPYIQLANAQ